MHPPLLLKYAPERLDEFGEKGGVVEMLLSMPQLLLLIVGGSGVGKSSLCNTIVQTYYGKQSPGVLEDNVLTINTLKDQGVAYYRTDVKCFCQTKGSIAAKKKIVIVDDMDAISEPAQQVFLSCIDQFKRNVIFLATCRSTAKILDNIHSRMVVLQLPPFSDELLGRLLRRVAEGEGVRVDAEAEAALVLRCNHSARLLLNFMEKFRLLRQPVTADLVRAECSTVQEAYLQGLVASVRAGRLREAIALADEVYAAGYSVMDIFDALFAYLKLGESGLSEEQTFQWVQLLCKYIYAVNHVHEHAIELQFFLAECCALV